ncbi:5-formyltetrahydrofolate cyclo-ligase [Sediminimonas sp.]|uniref:5-formyltetrahydrofolate cyclo-ligase n=1 Tax=Sediminimonas sp. TaxID=2823379 RepID=UPI0025EF5474|nr:5-formyltetrahydrofolate cyclo-ligase [Sediminimonas sp.]
MPTPHDRDETPPPASAPCLAHELPASAPAPGPDGVTPPQAVARWRRAERTRLVAARKASGQAARARIDAALTRHLHDLVARLAGGVAGRVIAGYWPIRGEPDLRPLLRDWREAGATIVLPVVTAPATPLAFRLFAPDTALERGHWGIPVPPETAPQMTPDIVLAPLVGWDAAGYRLGHGGGYFDRTLAAFERRPVAIGVGLQGACLATIHPQPHDIAMDHIVTEAGPQPAARAAP